MMSETEQGEIEVLLATMVQKVADIISEQKDFCFDISFEVYEKKYRLSLTADKEFSYLKDN